MKMSAQSLPVTLIKPQHITAISSDDHGDTLIMAAEDGTFQLYNCKTGKLVCN